MKKIITALTTLCIASSVSLTAHAAEMLNKDYIESEIWEEIWLGRNDDGTEYPEASYKHHILDKWIDENYGSDDYDWSKIGELKYEYKDYYKRLIEDWDFNDDRNGSWTINTEDNSYHFQLINNQWNMIDKNGDTVDTFSPFRTLEEDETEAASGYEIHDDGEDSPRVVGEVTGRTETASEGGSSVKGNDTARTA